MFDPDLYQGNNSLQKKNAIEYLEKHASRLKRKNNTRVIDIGCGDGGVTKMLKTFLPSNSKLLACDINEDMVRFAADHCDNDKISFIVLDIAGDMPNELKGNFDQAFSFFSLHWIKDQKRALQNIFDLLDQDGEFSLIIVCYTSIFDVYRAIAQSKWSTWVYDVEKYVSPYHDSEEPHKQLTKLMENIGFVDVNAELLESSFLFDSDDKRRNFLSALCPFKIPKDQYDDFMKDCFKVMDDLQRNDRVNTDCSSTDPAVHYTLVMLCARKPLASAVLI